MITNHDGSGGAFPSAPLLVTVLVHRVLAVVVVPELLGVRQDGEEDAAHAAHAQVICSDAGRVLGLDLRAGQQAGRQAGM